MKKENLAETNLVGAAQKRNTKNARECFAFRAQENKAKSQDEAVCFWREK